MKILIAGDLCPKCRVQEAFDKKDYSALEAMKPFIASADYSIVNFECPVVVDSIAKPIKKCGPCLKTSPNAVEAVQYAGFDCVTLANNHFCDFGDVGCITTIELLKKNKIDFVGGGYNIGEAQQILYKQFGNKKIAIVNFCENEFSIATESQAGSAPLDAVDNYNQITKARTNADFVLVIVHGGHEFYQLPSPRMKKLYRHFVTLGADAVVNHHQHCYSGYEYFNGKPIVYGLGNFCFDWTGKRKSIWNEGYCVEIETNTLLLKLIPYRQCDNNATVTPMEAQDIITFNLRISELNKIIADDRLLYAEFENWVGAHARNKMNIFSPYFHRFLNAVANKGWLPTRLNAMRAGILLNHISCEAHRDITIMVMKDRLIGKR